MNHKQHQQWEELQEKRHEIEKYLNDEKNQYPSETRRLKIKELREVKSKINKLYIKAKGL